MNRRYTRPYEKRRSNKGGALLFLMGVSALLATVFIIVAVTVPGINRRLENLPLYARTYYRKLVPHPEFLPTPAPTVSIAGTLGQDNGGQVQMNLPDTETEVHPPPNTASDQVVLISPNAENSLDTQDTNSRPAVMNLQQTDNKIELAGITHQWQTWNNCGPATITMNMSYFDRPETQVEAAQFLKPNKNDKNVNPQELAAYPRTVGMDAIVRHGGSIDQLKQFLSNGMPVLAETWLVHDGDGLGHYRLLTGFDDSTRRFTTFDSLNGPDYTVSYDQFDADWRVFNRLYLVIYPPARADVVHSIIGPDINDTVMYNRLATETQAEIEINPSDAVAYFNQGEALTRLGRYQDAVAAFDQARTLGLHWRRLWYQFTPFEAYYSVGRYQDVLDLTQATIEGTGGLEEAYYYQGLALQATGQTGPEEAFQAAIAYNPNFIPAQKALDSLTTNQ